MRIIQNRFLRNVSANTLQLIINQLFGLLIFYALSKGFDKDLFGQVNWALAVLLTVFTVLSFGIDQLLAKQIAAGQDRQPAFAKYFFHVLISGIIFYGILLIQYFLFPVAIKQQTLLLFIAIGKLFIFLSTPFKQVATGLEKFTALFYMSIISNIIRGAGLFLLLVLGYMTVNNVLLLFIIGDLLELFGCFIISRPILGPALKLRWNRKEQFLFLRESLPQAGVVICTAVMARLDWILIGILISSIKLAEYSFAWKMFELASLPLFILAPIMIPLFTRIFKQPGSQGDPSFFLEWQIIVACFVALLLNTCWVPVVDFISDGKYGAVNTQTIFILSLCMPLLYFNNYLWTINFAQGKLKLIFSVIAISFVVNILSCAILIPLFQNEGAAFAYLLTLLVQSALYLQKTTFAMGPNRKIRLLIWPFMAFVIGFITNKYVPGNTYGVYISVLIFISAVLTSKQVKGKDWQTLQSLYQ